MKYNIADLTNELYRIFDILNEHYFDSNLEYPIITLQQDGYDTYGHFITPQTWAVIGSDERFYEININPLLLNRDTNDVIGTLLHEMVHFDNTVKGINDTTKAGKHNKKFKTSAEAVDLIVDDEDFAVTTVSPKLEEFITNVIQPNLDCFKLYMDYPDVEPKEPKPRKKTQFKYICPKCGMVAKAKAELNIVCGTCHETLEMEDVEEDILVEGLFDV